jgi:hypothetical protein
LWRDGEFAGAGFEIAKFSGITEDAQQLQFILCHDYS